MAIRKKRQTNLKEDVVFSFLPQCDVGGYNTGNNDGGGGTPPPGPDQTAWDVAGIWTKIEDAQHQTIVDYSKTGKAALDQTHNWFPVNYADNPNSATNLDSVFGQLSRWIWYKGIQYTVKWGSVEDLNRASGRFRWDEIDYVMNTIRDLYAITGLDSAKNKKVIFLLSYKAFSTSAIDDILPVDLQTTSGTYSNGMIKYDRAMGFNSGFAGRVVNGYALRLQDFKDGLTGLDRNNDPIYTLRDRYYEFVTELYNRYKDHPVFGGICNTEPTPSDVSAFYGGSAEYNKNAYFDGRLKLLQKLKTVFTRHLVADAIDLHNDNWSSAVPKLGTEVLAENRLAFINPNFYTGLNLDSIYAAADTLAGVVPILNSCQGLDMDSKSGFFLKGNFNSSPNPVDIYDFKPTPPNYGNPRTGIQNPNVHWNSSNQKIVDSYDPPDANWVIQRARYLKTNILMYQHNYATNGNMGSTTRYNWKNFYTAINTGNIASPNGGLVKNDPLGGMVGDRPLYVAGEP